MRSHGLTARIRARALCGIARPKNPPAGGAGSETERNGSRSSYRRRRRRGWRGPARPRNAPPGIHAGIHPRNRRGNTPCSPARPEIGGGTRRRGFRRARRVRPVPCTRHGGDPSRTSKRSRLPVRPCRRRGLVWSLAGIHRGAVETDVGKGARPPRRRAQAVSPLAVTGEGVRRCTTSIPSRTVTCGS